jgi:uncharacterized protein YdeI (YjbR/CyaY-like superfamily)
VTDDRPGRLGGTPERPARFFADAAEFRAWLEANHDSAAELWMGSYKKHVAERGLVWEEAVPEALCFGWIDSRAERIDDDAMRQRWTPRRPGSVWSTVNINLVAELTAQGRMRPAGLAAFAKRREDRSSIYSHEQGDIELPPEFAARLAADARAAMFFTAATPTYRKIATHWVVSAKQEATRHKRMAQLIADSAAGQLIPSQRYGKEPVWVAKARTLLDDPD